jgi:GNAT superfamily N-acetyltransferase
LSAGLRIREAEPADVELIFSLIVELAEYERARERVVGTSDLLAESLFGEDRVAEAVIAELDGESAGFALWFRTFSTWLCRPGLWLEDLYVSPHQRRGGVGRALLAHIARIAVGRALLAHIARIAVGRGYGRVEWSALHWNVPALDFYEAQGAEVLHEWRMRRLEGEALSRVAGGLG